MKSIAPRPARRAAAAALAGVAMLAACADQPTTPSAAADAPPGARMAIDPGPYTPGQRYTGRAGYIEYVAGNLPVIFTAPHGGGLLPGEILDRNDTRCGGDANLVGDDYTVELVEAIRAAFLERTGKTPHIVINHLHRRKLDANRSRAEGACTDYEAEVAWDEYHDFIRVAKSRVLSDYGRGWYTDVHGHGHTKQRLELGYEVTRTQLGYDDSVLDGTTTYENASTLRTFSARSPLSFSALLRGNTALGTLLANEGYPSVPSAQDRAPAAADDYFDGGYNTETHTCRAGGEICGVQIEHNKIGVRDTHENRTRYARALVRAYEVYLAQNFGISLSSTGGEVIVDNDNANNDTNRARFSAAASWTTGSDNAQKHLNSFDFAEGNGPTGEGAEFLFYVSAPDTYDVYAWWPASSNRSPSASYRVFELDGGTMLADLKVDQTTNGGRWYLLGRYTFSQTGWAKVLMSRSLSGDGRIAADAIRVVRR